MKTGVIIRCIGVVIIACGIVNSTCPMLSRAQSVSRSVAQQSRSAYQNVSQRAYAFINYFRKAPQVTARSYSQPSYKGQVGDQQVAARDINKLLRAKLPSIEAQLQKPQKTSILSDFAHRIFNIDTAQDLINKKLDELHVKRNSLLQKTGEMLGALATSTSKKVGEQAELMKKLNETIPLQEELYGDSALYKKAETIGKELRDKIGMQTNVKQAEQIISNFSTQYVNAINEAILTQNQDIDPQGLGIFRANTTTFEILQMINSIMIRVAEILNPTHIPAEIAFAGFYPLIQKIKILNKNLKNDYKFGFVNWSRSEPKIYTDLNMGSVKITATSGEPKPVKTYTGKDRLRLYIFLDGLRDLGVAQANDYIDQLKIFAETRDESDLSFMLEDVFTIDQLPPALRAELGEAWNNEPTTIPTPSSQSVQASSTTVGLPKVAKRSYHTSARTQQAQKKEEKGWLSGLFGSKTPTPQEFFTEVDSYLNGTMTPQVFLEEIPTFKSVINAKRPVTLFDKSLNPYSVEQSALETIFDTLAFVDIFRGFDPETVSIVPNTLMSKIAHMQNGSDALGKLEWDLRVIGSFGSAGALLDVDAIKTILLTMHYFETYLSRANVYGVKLPHYENFNYQKFRTYYVDALRPLLVPFINKLGLSFGQLDAELSKKADQDINEFFMRKYIEVKKTELRQARNPMSDKDVMAPEQIDMMQERLDIDSERVRNKECGAEFDAQYESRKEAIARDYIRAHDKK
jgi:hypothetical protein